MENNKFHILVVDDDDKIRDLIKQFLNENGFIVSTAIDAKEAKSKIDVFNFNYDYSKYDVLNTQTYSIPVNIGTCVIFPSHVTHWVEDIDTGGERIVMGFNCFVKGKFDGRGYATDLLLKGS